MDNLDNLDTHQQIVATIIRHLNQDGMIDQLLDNAPSTWERRQRYLWICAYIDGFLRFIDTMFQKQEGIAT